ncbi:putative uncharacterized protein DDB_G0286901 [Teleopsis dalmanni]|uniref:putative uncharacterized protein DDB_G0286901 n=1 Tax=Teleopsis dalmanni TaxID=139649 RepID=UPI0018CF162E|nr:putative uncharacterized protein DDB_G0286901 [Teleopsis dalmanni]XP_037955250.1 putative uncharacterized protein DDB_G0286901 [Teleopsis dalmanni]XP_037955251.1 putative uncharacterized protein DDB_G0286901 [Teleopsis dalmanni]XP_037955252.1 putative uncharacterized protein DDB_G0286901 [Teleopsis dalmanni]
MAVFLINICKFNGCGITFPSLGDLIQHIEDTHIDYDPKVVEQKEQAQPACLPLSYVLRFISEDARKENFLAAGNAAGVELKRKIAIKHHSYSMSSSNRSNTPTGSEMDEDEIVASDSEDSNDSWTTEEFSSEFIMRYGSRHSGPTANGGIGNEKPFACPVPGCKKRYKNVNGIKYHSKNGHKKDGKVRKGYKCHCGKSYKTAQGLKNHAIVAHNSTPDTILTQQNVVNVVSNTQLLQRSGSPSQSMGSLSPSSISNMSSSASSCHGGSTNLHNGNNSTVVQHLSNNIAGNNGLTAITAANISLQHQHQHQQQQTQTTQPHLTISNSINNHGQTVLGTGNNNIVRSTIGFIKTNNSTSVGTTTIKTASATNLLAANAAASKILKLATNAAAAGNNNIVELTQQHKLQQTVESLNNKQLQTKLQLQQSPQTTPTKITLPPNLVNLGILTPATSPTKSTQSITFTQQQNNTITNLTAANLLQQKIQNGSNSNSNSNNNCTNNIHNTPSHNTTKTNILLVEQSPTTPTQQQHNLPLTPISPNNTPVQQKSVASALTAALQQHKKQSIVGSIHLTSVTTTTTTSNVGNANGNGIGNSSSNGNACNTSSITNNCNKSIINALSNAVVAAADAGAIAISDET